MVSNSHRIDLNRGFASTAGVTTGTDITAALQAAVNYIAANYPAGGVIELEPGTYNLQGAQQTGTYQIVATTVNGAAQTISTTPSTLNVASTSGASAQGGQIAVAGVTGIVTYTGISGNSFTGCTIASGSFTATNGGTVAVNYNYSGQVLMPAVSLANTMGITIRAKARGSSGDSNTGGPSGVILVSNATSGYVIDCIPSFTRFSGAWTGVIPFLEDVSIQVPDNPQCGGVNFYCTQRCRLERVNVHNTNFEGLLPSGGLPGLILPAVENNGDITLRDVSVQGFTTGTVLSEHNVLDNVLVAGCATAFGTSGFSHANYFQYVDVEECPVVFSTAAIPGLPINPVAAAGTNVFGYMDYESNTGVLAPTAFVSDSFASKCQGKIFLFTANGKPAGVSGGRYLDIAPLNLSGSTAPSNSEGWKNTHPFDNFQRLTTISGAAQGAPGQCTPTLHPWRVDTQQNASSSFAIATQGRLTALSAGSYAYLPAKGAQSGGASTQGMQTSRNVTALVNLASGGSIYLIVSNPVVVLNNQVVSIASGVPEGIVVRMNQGSQPILRVTNSNITGSIGSSLAAGAHICSVSVLCNDLGYPQWVKVYMDGVLIYAGGMPNNSFGGANPSVYPYYEDGLYIGDTTSYVTQFQVTDIAPQAAVPLGGVVNGISTNRTQNAGETTIVTSGSPTITTAFTAPGLPPSTVANAGAGSVTYAPQAGVLTHLDGTTGNLTIAANKSATVVCDGTNWWQVA